MGRAEAADTIARALNRIDNHGYVLDDVSDVMAPHEWASAAIALYRERCADRIIAETNNGGEMVETTLRMIDPNVAYG